MYNIIVYQFIVNLQNNKLKFSYDGECVCVCVCFQHPTFCIVCSYMPFGVRATRTLVDDGRNTYSVVHTMQICRPKSLLYVMSAFEYYMITYMYCIYMYLYIHICIYVLGICAEAKRCACICVDDLNIKHLIKFHPHKIALLTRTHIQYIYTNIKCCV